MRILLINPWAGEVFPPPSIGYLQAAAKGAGAQVCAMDLTDDGLQWAKEQIWDVVGVTFHSFSVQYATKLRAAFKGTRLICGGHHPSALPEQMLAAGYDQVITGEGELAIIDIINGNTNSIIKGATPDINQLAPPDYTGLAYSGAMGLPIISSRGCPYDCSFCASARFWGNRYRMRTAENVLAEIQAKGVKQFMFEDDNFTMNRQRVIDICTGLRDMGGLSWQCASRAETLVDDELCWNLKTAGCHTVWLGIESLSQATLDRCSKRTTVGRMLAGIKVAHTHGLGTMSQFIIGLPEDTLADIQETARNITANKIGRKGCNVLWVLPDTDVHRRAKMQGFDDATYLHAGAPYYTYEQSYETLQQWAAIINKA